MRVLTFVCLICLCRCHSRDESTPEQKVRLEKDYAAADKKMNALFAELYKAGDLENRLLLEKSQKAWLEYRAAESQFQHDQWRGGSIAPLFATQRKIELTERRIKDFEQDLHPEGR